MPSGLNPPHFASDLALNTTNLPVPDAQGIAHSAKLMDHLKQEITRAGGWISFTQYMHTVLYAPEHGYYTGGATKLGSAGDFTTAPELTPIFGQTLATQLAQILRVTGGGIIELGAGSGKLARDILLTLHACDVLPEQYCILDVSGELRQRQREVLEALPAAVLEHVRWIDRLPDDITGVVLGNEVLDALPVHLVAWQDDGICERGVVARGDGFEFHDVVLTHPHVLAAANGIEVPRPYVSEIGLASVALTKEISKRMAHGLIVFIDYGFGAAEFYHPQRHRGTLMCHYRHHAHDDPFLYPGLQDITAHVNFTAVASAGVEAGMEMAGYSTQARFLANAGLTQWLARLDPYGADYARSVAPVQTLMSPAEMGELFKVLALCKGIDQPLLGFTSGDLSRLL